MKQQIHWNDIFSRLRSAGMVIVVDDESRENEGDLVMAAELVTDQDINFMSQHGRGLICMPMLAEKMQQLNISMMTSDNQSSFQTPFGVSIGASHGVTTGISAADRAHTIRTAANPQSTPDDIVMPGHIFPLRANQSGVLARKGHTEASIDLMKAAGLNPAAVICEIMNPDGTMARAKDLQKFSAQHGLPIISIEQIIQYQVMHNPSIRQVASAQLPTKYGDFAVTIYQQPQSPLEHLVLHSAKPLKNNVLNVRLHSECLTGDILGSLRCDCGWQLDTSMKYIAEHGGVLIYLRQEGRGIGLRNKIMAYSLQDEGMDTVTANQHLGFAADERDYIFAAQILHLLDIKRINLITNNPQKISAMSRFGIEVVERKSCIMKPHDHNSFYLRTKKEKMGHLLDIDG